MKKITLLFYFFAFVALSLFSTSLEEIIDKEIRFNRWEEAKKELEGYIKNKNDDVFAYSLYSAVLKELKLYDEAILALRNAITYEKSDKKKGEIYFNIGNLFYEKKQNDIALEMYEKSIEFDNMSAPSYYMSGLISFEKNNLENALKSWKRYVGLTLDKEKKEKVSQIVTMIEKDIEDKKQAEIKRLEEERVRLEEEKKRKEEEERRRAEEKRKREEDERNRYEREKREREAEERRLAEEKRKREEDERVRLEEEKKKKEEEEKRLAEEKRKREEALNSLKELLQSEKRDSKSLEEYKIKKTKKNTDFEEIE